MSDEYSLWRVTFSYESASEHIGTREREFYIVPAKKKDEAEQKSFAHFSKTSIYTDFLHSQKELVRITTTRMKNSKITLPQLTLTEDRQQFLISPRLSSDNSSIEYVVHELSRR